MLRESLARHIASASPRDVRTNGQGLVSKGGTRKRSGRPHPFSGVDVNLGEKQLVAVVVLSRPVGHQLLDVGQVADEALTRGRGSEERTRVPLLKQSSTFHL